jgi:hypothetical protein
MVNHHKTATTISSLNNIKDLLPMGAENEDTGLPDPFPASPVQDAEHLPSSFPLAFPSAPRNEVANSPTAAPNDKSLSEPVIALTLTLADLQLHFPQPGDDSIRVKFWIQSALKRRGSADHWWVDNLVWIGDDLYVLPQQEIGNALTRFGAGYDVSLGVARDIVGARIVRV